MRIRVLLAVASLTATAGLLSFNTAAQAALTTSCVGDGGAVTVPGDLIVPAGKSCRLTGTVINGNVTVRAGADLVATGVTVNGTVTVQENGYLDVATTNVTGILTTRSAFGAFLKDSQFGAAINTRVVDGSTVQGFLYSINSIVSGGVDARTGELYVSGSTIGGGLAGTNTSYTDVYNTVVEGALTVKGNALGSVFCESEVYGNASYDGNSDTVQIGAAGPLGECVGASYFGKNVALTNNTATVVLDNTILRSTLTAAANTPTIQVGPTARVRGGVTGDTTSLAGALSARASKAAPVAHADQLKAQADQRRSQAAAQAHSAGQARL